ncbi:hypothetical protein ACFOOM_00830 [Streptomyces echinoruber]|uniref:Uncharacterized protein n=1 Tax=Streptomyces echinoruber TaxID=68898 RepID=A0A918V7P9_9ACTN|nr:hypothetical protein [Streptomyces echinoruber]GGZ73343.1 hypothetical protein GCM10010389_08690 [Streptomyces echinoruber]
MARCQCGGGGCNCVVIAGENTDVTGSGSPANPYVVNAETNCGQVRTCIAAGPGLDYDPATGIVSADLSEQAGNNLILAPDGGLFVPTGAATVSAGCGLTGNGSASNPIRVATGSWPYECDLDTLASGVYCDSTGVLRSEPPARARFQQNTLNNTLASPALVPTVSEQQVATLQLSIVNPDPCRDALCLLFQEVDIDLTLPPNSGGMYGIDTDDMVHLGNTGSGTITGTHAQVNKLTNLTLTAGETSTHTMSIVMGRGSGSARYSRIQATLRAWVISLPTA